MQLYFIRHAQSENNALYAATGSDAGRAADPELTELGQQQAERLAHTLSQPFTPSSDWGQSIANRDGFGLTHLYCSLMVRAVATAVILGRALRLPPVAWPEAHESGGIVQADPDGEPIGLPGNGRAYFKRHYPDLCLPDDLGDSGWWNRPPESREDRPARAERVWNELLARHSQTDDRIGLVSHGGFYNYLLSTALGLGPRNGRWLLMNNAAITRLDLRPTEVVLVYANRTDHLPAEFLT